MGLNEKMVVYVVKYCRCRAVEEQIATRGSGIGSPINRVRVGAGLLTLRLSLSYICWATVLEDGPDSVRRCTYIVNRKLDAHRECGTLYLRFLATVLTSERLGRYTSSMDNDTNGSRLASSTLVCV